MNTENKKNQTECPEESELQSYLTGKLSLAQMEAAERHIAFCDRCYLMLKVLEPSEAEEFEDEDCEVPQTLPEWMAGHGQELNERQKKINENKRTLEQILSNGGVKFAQVWEPKTDGILVVTPEGDQNYSFVDFNSVPHFVVVVNDDIDRILNRKLVRAFPIHDEEDLIKPDDLLLKEENSPTGYSFFIQSWNPCEILTDNLDVCIGEINFQEQTDLAKKLKNLGQKQQTKNANVYAAGTEEDVPEIGIDKNYFKKNYKNDPLVRYRYKEFKETAYLRVPAESLRETAELQKTSEKSLWERLLGLITGLDLGTNLVPVGGAAALILLVAGWLAYLFIFSSAPKNNGPDIAEGNKNVALPVTPNDQSNPQNSNGSNNSNGNSAEDKNSGSSNQTTDKESSTDEGGKTAPSPRNRINKKDSFDDPSKRRRKERQDRQQNQSRPIQQQPQLFAQRERDEQESPKFERDIGELPPRLNNDTTRNPNSVYRNFLLSPNGTFVKTTQPTLRWSRIAGVENYWVGVFVPGRDAIDAAFVNGNSWTANVELTPGMSYRWKVVPVDKNRVAIPIGNQSLEGSFKVLSNAQQKRVAKAELTEQTPSLKLARVYLKNALFEDAITELENYLIANPNSKEAKRLLELAENPQKIKRSKND